MIVELGLPCGVDALGNPGIPFCTVGPAVPWAIGGLSGMDGPVGFKGLTGPIMFGPVGFPLGGSSFGCFCSQLKQAIVDWL